MGSDIVKSSKLGSLCVKIGSGATPRGGSSVYLEHGDYSLIRSQNILDNSFSKNGLVFLDRTAAKKLDNVAVESGDVLLNITGDSVARCCQVDDTVLPARVNQHVAIIRPDNNEIDPKYLRYFLVSPHMQSIMLGLASAGATRNALTKGMIENFDIPVLPMKTQKAIADILGTLDDKIELNRQMNTTLEAMAQALYKSWFVDFDPVIDNALAAGNPIPDELAERAERRKQLHARTAASTSPHLNPGQPLPAAIQQQFPDRFVFTEAMGWVPEGWIPSRLSDLTKTISKGTTPNQNALLLATDEPEISFLKVRDIDDKNEIHIDSVDKIPRSIHLKILKRSVLEEGDVLFSIAGTIGRTSIINKELHNSNANQAIAFVRPKLLEHSNFIHQILKSEATQNLVHSRIVQAVQANFSLTELANLPILVPTHRLLDLWHEKTAVLFLQICNSRSSSRQLTKVRDTLLPKLLSGQLRIPEAEQHLAEVI